MPVLSCIKLNEQARRSLLEMAWRVLDNALQGHGLQLPPEPTEPQLLVPAACFVTLHQNGQLRGCIGSLEATEPLWLNVCHNTYSSGFRDRRFLPLSAEDRAGLSLDISILSDLIPMKNEGEPALLAKLRPSKDGLLLEDEFHHAVFLPSVWEVLPTAEQFVTALKQKGGWPQSYWHNHIKLYTFTTEVIRD
ncbi:AmmeMemoRadiSam system protein A [Vibrio mytili]|uniref:AMMECR1 domain-containing protein n=1 Tax=Vibrio mytili TaxID=50718 RepID=A0A0C3DK61_9VIBR|nr:AmmeMemoRadiSam system protein A [Vibrio mytili]KIN11839.1 hypothetical protein SU60_04760 [Vibrio mytili]